MVGDIGGTNARLSIWETKGSRDATEVHAKVGRWGIHGDATSPGLCAFAAAAALPNMQL